MYLSLLLAGVILAVTSAFTAFTFNPGAQISVRAKNLKKKKISKILGAHMKIHWTNTSLDCSHLNAFFMLNPNKNDNLSCHSNPCYQNIVITTQVFMNSGIFFINHKNGLSDLHFLCKDHDFTPSTFITTLQQKFCFTKISVAIWRPFEMGLAC